MYTNSTITYLSKPAYDEWGFGSYWSCADWIYWHKQLVLYYGLDEANRIFITAFHEGGFGAANYDCRTFDSDFKTYAYEHGFYDALFSGVSGLIVKPLSGGIDVVDSLGNIITNAGKTVLSVSEILRIAVPLLVVMAVVFLGLYGYTKASKA